MNSNKENFDKKTNSKGRDQHVDFAPLGGLLIGIILLFLTYWGFLNTFPAEERGTFGDMFGGLNTLFSGFAFVGIIYTIILQKNELSLQRREIESNSEELRKKNFESIFFNILFSKKEIIESMALTTTTRTGKDVRVEHKKGTSFIEDMIENLSLISQEINSVSSHLSPYERFHDRYGAYFEQYFNFLYQILKFIDQEPLNAENKKMYIDLLKTQLTAGELYFIFFHCSSPLVKETFKHLIENYSILEYLPVIIAEQHKDILKKYSILSFGQNSSLLKILHATGAQAQ